MDCWLVGSARTDNSRIALSCVDDCTSFYIKSSRLMGADVPDLFLGPSRLGCADLTCSLRMMLVMEGTRKEKKGLESLFILKNLVDLLKLLVANAYVGCMACAPCKRLCVEYTTFARKRLIAYLYDLCARGDLCVRCTSCARERLITYVSYDFCA